MSLKLCFLFDSLGVVGGTIHEKMECVVLLGKSHSVYCSQFTPSSNARPNRCVAQLYQEIWLISTMMKQERPKFMSRNKELLRS